MEPNDIISPNGIEKIRVKPKSFNDSKNAFKRFKVTSINIKSLPFKNT